MDDLVNEPAATAANDELPAVEPTADAQQNQRLDGQCNFAEGATPPTNDTEARTPSIDDVIIGFDTEWCPYPKNPDRNVVLAYSAYLISGGRSASILIVPGGPDPQHRITLGHLIGKAIEKGMKDGVIAAWPEAVTLAVHFGRGDLAALRDFALAKRQLDAVKGVLASTTGPIELDARTGESLDLLPVMPRGARAVRTRDKSRKKHVVKVTVCDTYLLAEAGSRSLEALGQQLGLEKLQLPDGYGYGEMDRLQQERPAEFEAYALRDAEVAARYCLWFRDFCRTRLDLSRMPPTLGAAAVRLARRSMKARGVDSESAFGVERARFRIYSEAAGRFRTVARRELSFARMKVELVAAAAYHGGRTETFMTGPVSAPELRDLDLQSAYPSAMCAIGLPDFEKAYDTTDVTLFTADALGFAQVEFETPEAIRFPVFGVKTERGLIFPRRGVTVATAPEIAAAVSLGIGVTVRHGVIVPWDRSVRPYEAFVVDMLTLRRDLKDASGQDTAESKMVKTLTNSVYGKIAQGVRARTVFDSRTGAMKPLSPSALTNPALAGYITGLCRATIAEMLNSIPREHVVVSVSTDGFLSSADLGDIGIGGPASGLMTATRVHIAEALGRTIEDPRREVLEVKRRATEVVAMRNRAIATTQVVAGSKPILAKGGVKVSASEDANAYILAIYVERGYYTREGRRDFIPLRTQYERDADLVTVKRRPLVNLEPDMKRKLVEARMAPFHPAGGEPGELLATNSVPYDTAAEALETMTVFDGWRKGGGRVLRALADWSAWTEFYAARTARRRAGGRVQVPRTGTELVLKRQFLRALMRNAWGLSRDGWTCAEVAIWLTGAGYPTSESDVKNAGRPTSKLVEGTVAATSATLDLLRVILGKFPRLDLARVFAADNLGEAMRSIG